MTPLFWLSPTETDTECLCCPPIPTPTPPSPSQPPSDLPIDRSPGAPPPSNGWPPFPVAFSTAGARIVNVCSMAGKLRIVSPALQVLTVTGVGTGTGTASRQASLRVNRPAG